MNVRRVLMLAVVAAASAGAAGRADAQAGYGCAGGYGYGYGGWGAWDAGRLYSVLAQNVPYYAAFPPVYYSLPVPRTYGYSPFAYPPGVMTPEVVVEAVPLSIVNPHFSPEGEASATVQDAAEAPVDRTTGVGAKSPAGDAKVQAQGGPLLIVNPYFERESRALAGR